MKFSPFASNKRERRFINGVREETSQGEDDSSEVGISHSFLFFFFISEILVQSILELSESLLMYVTRASNWTKVAIS